ncbi:MAG: helix-turn-helix domain-containing protein [Terrisporobacter sp.]|uniref:helix-turn-helix domain-containing protein n=1 Tax=Terrisporobacter sp. TaxID=1965305 RepID=UPI00399A1AD0
MNVGENIRKIRKEKKITQKQLSELINKNVRTIQKYENGEIEKIPFSTLMAIGRALDVSYTDLIEGKERKGLKVTVKLTETDIVENIIRMLKQVALDERIDKNIRDEYLADLSEQIGFDIVINDKPTDFKLDKNTHDNIMQKFTKVV